MSTKAYQCPCCGAPLQYSAQQGKLTCDSCGTSFDLEAVEAENQVPEGQGGIAFDLSAESFDAAEAGQMQAYVCKSCGAELMTEDTTTATECPYCGSPTILPNRIEGSVKPEKVIPFTVTKEQAQQQFTDYFKGKKLMPNIFLKGRNRIADIRRLYVPYWLFACDAHASISYHAEKQHTERSGEWEITRTRHYIVHRAGGMSFENIPVDGSQKLDDAITESLEPYDLSAAVPFQPAVLAGSLADCSDVDASACESRAVERVESSMAAALRDTVNGYTSVTEKNRQFSAEGCRATPVLLPVWLITTNKEGKTYTFAINGQTGKLTCDVPADMAKSFAWGGGVFAGVFALAALALYLTEYLASGTLLMAAVLAAIVALAVVGCLKAQLNQAVMQSEASSYVREGSFSLSEQSDHFLYETTQRRKIETNDDKDKK